MSVFKNQVTYWANLFDEEDSLSVIPYFKTAENASLTRVGYQEKASIAPYLQKYLKEY